MKSSAMKSKGTLCGMTYNKIYKLIFSFSFYIILILLIFGVAEVLLMLTPKIAKHASTQRVEEFLNFVKIVKTLIPILLLIPISRKLSGSFAQIKYKVFCDTLVLGAFIGLFISFECSLIHFIVSLLNSRVIDAILNFISFLWRSWGYILKYSFFVTLFTVILIIIKNKDEIEEIFKKYVRNEEEQDDNEKDNSD